MRPQLYHHIKNSGKKNQLATQYTKRNKHEANEEGHLLAYHEARKSEKTNPLVTQFTTQNKYTTKDLNLLHKISIQ